jgi:hypothetical protein
MADDLLAQLIAEPRSLTEELRGRPAHLRIFVSSKMRGGTYVEERLLCAEVIDRTGLFQSWTWERNTKAGPYCALDICLGHAATVDGLILIVGDELTDTTRQEYEVARARGVRTFVLIDQRETQTEETREFIAQVRAEAVTQSFENLAELEAHVIGAIREMNSLNWRRQAFADWQRRQQGEAA